MFRGKRATLAAGRPSDVAVFGRDKQLRTVRVLLAAIAQMSRYGFVRIAGRSVASDGGARGAGARFHSR